MSKRGLASRLAWAGGAAAMVLAFAPCSAWAKCSVDAKVPEVRRIDGVRTLVGHGSRGSDCHERKLLTVQLRQNRRWWPDKTLAETKFTFTNGQLSVKYPCNGAGVKSVFTKAWLQGETPVQSPAKGFDACG